MSALSEPIRVNLTKQLQPYLIYLRTALTHFREYINYTLPYGYGYLLRRVLANWPTVNPAGVKYSGNLRLEFMGVGTWKSRQIDPNPLSLFSSPAGQGDDLAGPGVRQYAGVGGAVVFTSANRASWRILNYQYLFGDTFNLHVTGQDSIDPAYFDLVLHGYLIPERSLSMWQGGQQ
jgi:hypothetical protein